ncbi:MAG: hypothetical protein K9N06_02935 [Candidatus Cloacimonetes bacterium]|nr:hypothetical protein [Candidatus Cloacimonadota bacterium]
MFKKLFILIFSISLTACPHKLEIPKDYNSSEDPVTSRRFQWFYNAHCQRNQVNIREAEKELQTVAANWIKPKELEKKTFELIWQAKPSDFTMTNALACQVDPMGDILTILEKFSDDYTTYLKYKGETIKLNQSDERLINGNLSVKFYLPFRWSHTSDIIAYSANDKAYNQLFLAFVIKYEDTPLSKFFQVTDDLKDVYYYDPVWSFDDEFLAYTQENMNGSIIKILDLKKQEISSLKLEKQTHCFRFSTKGGYAAFAVVKENDNYVPIVFSDWRKSDVYTSFPSLSSNCPLMRASYADNGDRIALLQYTSSTMDSLRLAIIDIESEQVYPAEKKLVKEDEFEYEITPMSDPVWLYDDNFLICTSKKEVFYSFVNRINLERAYDILYLKPYTASNISNVISPSFSPVKNEVIFFNPIEKNNAYTFKDYKKEENDRPELVQTMYWETMIEDFNDKPEDKGGKKFSGKTRLKIISNNFIPKESVPPDRQKEGLVFKQKIKNKYVWTLQFDEAPKKGEIVILQWDIQLTQSANIRGGTFYTELLETTSYKETTVVK